VIAAPHFGHLAFRPAIVVGALILAEQVGQVMSTVGDGMGIPWGRNCGR
jgi:hypothetical protein